MGDEREKLFPAPSKSKKRWIGLWDRQFWFEREKKNINLSIKIFSLMTRWTFAREEPFYILCLISPSFQSGDWYLVEANAKGPDRSWNPLSDSALRIYLSCHLIFCRGWFTICIIKAEWSSSESRMFAERVYLYENGMLLLAFMR